MLLLCFFCEIKAVCVQICFSTLITAFHQNLVSNPIIHGRWIVLCLGGLPRWHGGDGVSCDLSLSWSWGELEKKRGTGMGYCVGNGEERDGKGLTAGFFNKRGFGPGYNKRSVGWCFWWAKGG